MSSRVPSSRPTSTSILRRKDDQLLRRVIGLQVAILLAVLSDLALRLAA